MQIQIGDLVKVREKKECTWHVPETGLVVGSKPSRVDTRKIFKVLWSSDQTYHFSYEDELELISASR